MKSSLPTSLSRRQFLVSASVTGASAISVSLAQQNPAPPGASNAAASSPGPSGDDPAEPLPPQELPAPPDRQPPGLKVPEPVTRRIGWAIVGLGELALNEILPAFAECRLGKPVALVSGHPDKARKVAETYGIPLQNILGYQNYQKLAEMPDVEAVYIVLPNSMHASFTIQALEAGKHVLCEKPMAATVEEAERMQAAARAARKKLMIAYRLHYEPLNRKAMEICREKKQLGKIKLFTSSNCQNVEMPNIRLSRKLAGGPVGDVGVYSINAARYILGEEPVLVHAVEHRPEGDPRFQEVPESVAYTLQYPSGAVASCVCSFGTAGSQRYEAIGDQGTLVMDPAFPYRGLKLMVSRPKGAEGPEKAELNLRQINQFASEMDHFSECILEDREPRTPAAMGVADMKIIVAIGRAAAEGKPVKITI